MTVILKIRSTLGEKTSLLCQRILAPNRPCQSRNDGRRRSTTSVSSRPPALHRVQPRICIQEILDFHAPLAPNVRQVSALRLVLGIRTLNCVYDKGRLLAFEFHVHKFSRLISTCKVLPWIISILLQPCNIASSQKDPQNSYRKGVFQVV